MNTDDVVFKVVVPPPSVQVVKRTIPTLKGEPAGDPRHDPDDKPSIGEERAECVE